MPYEVQHRSGKLAAAARWRAKNDQTESRRNLAIAKIEKHVACIVTEAPPNTGERCEHLSGLPSGAA